MASNEKRGRFDFEVFSEVPYMLDPMLEPDTFFEDMTGMFHIGPGTDLRKRLFELSLTRNDIKFLKGLMIDSMR